MQGDHFRIVGLSSRRCRRSEIMRVTSTMRKKNKKFRKVGKIKWKNSIIILMLLSEPTTYLDPTII
jgi:hypothetical protein